MRKFVLALVLLAAVPSVASARLDDKGDGTFAVKNATGVITVVAKGTALGRLDDGKIEVLDTTPSGSSVDEIQVIGYDRKPVTKANGVTVYRGQDMRFRIVGSYILTLTGSGVNVSAVGRGTVQGMAVSEGLFSTDGSPFKPASAALYAASFGLQ